MTKYTIGFKGYLNIYAESKDIAEDIGKDIVSSFPIVDGSSELTYVMGR